MKSKMAATNKSVQMPQTLIRTHEKSLETHNFLRSFVLCEYGALDCVKDVFRSVWVWMFRVCMNRLG